MNAKKSRIRHIAKTITWRLIASLTTFILAYVFTQVSFAKTMYSPSKDIFHFGLPELDASQRRHLDEIVLAS